MTKDSSLPVRRALISVSDKTGVVEFARTLRELNIELLSSGGTCKLLREAGLAATEIAEYTGFPEIMEGRVKTLHPKIHGGILARRDLDQAVMEQHGLAPIDMVVVNLYPFQEAIARPDCDLAAAVANIDVGGPAMIRAAAKNHAYVSVIVSPDDYSEIARQLRENHCRISAETRHRLAVHAFRHTAHYDAAIADYLGKPELDNASEFPQTYHCRFIKKQSLRYGENPHQKAAFYVEPAPRESAVATAAQLQGKALSFNNINDADAALECVKSFDEPTCVIVKHANPCGTASAPVLLEAYQKAWQADPTSAFGGIIACNRELDKATAQAIVEQQFAEVIIAPAATEGAKAALGAKKNLRLLVCGDLPQEPAPAHDLKRVGGGLLVQSPDLGVIAKADLRVVSRRQPSEAEISDLLFAWKVAKFVKSNAIVLARQGQTVGIGAGQMNRLHSVKIATMKAAEEGLETKGATLASDAFFPFPDGVEAAAEAGIGAIIQPGGALRDDEIIATADSLGLAMVFTGMRHFRH